MERIPKKNYTKDFREEAVKLITEGGLRIPDTSRRLTLPSSTITYWVIKPESPSIIVTFLLSLHRAVHLYPRALLENVWRAIHPLVS
jgi:hypothetical protein